MWTQANELNGKGAALSSAPYEREADFSRCQHTLGVAVYTALGVAVILQVVSVKTVWHWLATLALVAVGGASLYVRREQARSQRLQFRLLEPLGIATAVAALTALAYVGPFTAGAIVLSPICYVFGYSENKRLGNRVAWTATGGFALIALCALVGWLDPAAGPVGITARRPWLAVIALTLVSEVVMVSAFRMARRSRRVLRECLEKIEKAHAELDHRGVQLEHARWDLDHVIELAQVGHLTGTRMGAYRIGELIGRGGMGEVYRAWSGDGSHPVALKVLTPSMASNPAVVERFFREARVSSSLASEHIVEVHDSGWADGGYPFLAMELLRGRDLAVHLEEVGTMSLPEIVDLVDQIASALVVAHNVGIVHRDVKPENVFRAHGGRGAGTRWVVLDFGVSKVKGGSGTLTGGGMIGTPRYMAPEQARGATVDPRADVFSLGAIVYRCITGHQAFDAEDALASLVQVMSDQPLRPTAHADMPLDVELVLALALAKEPKYRLPSVATFAVALADACRGELADDLRRQAHAILERAPWNDDELDAVTIRPGEWLFESGEQRIHTAPLPDVPERFLPPPPPPRRERDESITSLAC